MRQVPAGMGWVKRCGGLLPTIHKSYTWFDIWKREWSRERGRFIFPGMAEQESLQSENGKQNPADYESFGREDKLATVSWYLVASGIISLILAALCLWMGRIGATEFFTHKDFSLNPNALGRYLLLAGIDLID